MSTPISYQRAVTKLREALKRHGFETLCELPLDRELKRKVGLHWQHCTVFVVWSPFEAYQVLLSDRNGGVLVPVNLCVAKERDSTLLAVINHGAWSANSGSLGLQVMVRDIADKIRDVLAEASMPEEIGQCN